MKVEKILNEIIKMKINENRIFNIGNDKLLLVNNYARNDEKYTALKLYFGVEVDDEEYIFDRLVEVRIYNCNNKKDIRDGIEHMI